MAERMVKSNLEKTYAQLPEVVGRWVGSVGGLGLVAGLAEEARAAIADCL